MGDKYGSRDLLNTYVVLGRASLKIREQHTKTEMTLANMRDQLGGPDKIDTEAERLFGTKNPSKEQLIRYQAERLTREEFEESANAVAAIFGESAKNEMMAMYDSMKKTPPYP